MRNFKNEKDKLIIELDSEIVNNPENKTLNYLKQILDSYIYVSDLNGDLGRIVVDSLNFEFEIGVALIEFENYFLDLSNSIHSPDLKKLAKLLVKNDVQITFFGKAWSKNIANWIYFDKVFDLKKLRKKMSFDRNIIDHYNLDNKSGLECGFIDENTREGIMGKLK